MKQERARREKPHPREGFRTRQFAEAGGVTAKALLHYERLGLLTPPRTSAGHRVYSSRDLERLRHILALKRVGIPLGRVRQLINASPGLLGARLEMSREALAQEQARLFRADRAITLVVESLHHDPDEGRALGRLADVLDMDGEIELMRRYFDPEVWHAAKRLYQDWPREEWIALYREVAAAIPEGPASARAESLLHRWNMLGQSLWRDLGADPDQSRALRDGFAHAWQDRENWPGSLKRRFADYRISEIAAFLGKASIVVLNRRGPAWFAAQQAGSHVA